MRKKCQQRSQHMKMLQQVLRSSSEGGEYSKQLSTLDGLPLGDPVVYNRMLTPKNGRMGSVAFVVTDLEHSTAMSNTDGVAFKELQILHDNVRVLLCGRSRNLVEL